MHTHKLGSMRDRTHRELIAEDMDPIAGTYYRWRGFVMDYEDESGICQRAQLAELRCQRHVLTPGRYIGAPIAEDDGELYTDNLQQLVQNCSTNMPEAQC